MRNKNEAIKKYLSNDTSQSLESIVDKSEGYSQENERLVYKYLLKKRKNRKTKALVFNKSGDEILNPIYYGFKEVTAFSDNPLNEVVAELKGAAIDNLSYNKFLYMWRPHHILDSDMYRQISHSLNDTSREFWDYVINRGCGACEMPKLSAIMRLDTFRHKGSGSYREGSEFYDNEKKFNQLKERRKAAKVTYIKTKPDVLTTEVDEKFDIITLSDLHTRSNSYNFFEFALNLRRHNLDRNGRMELFYDLGQASFFEQILEQSQMKDVVNKTIVDVESYGEKNKPFIYKALDFLQFNKKDVIYDYFVREYSNAYFTDGIAEQEA